MKAIASATLALTLFVLGAFAAEVALKPDDRLRSRIDKLNEGLRKLARPALGHVFADGLWEASAILGGPALEQNHQDIRSWAFDHGSPGAEALVKRARRPGSTR